MTTVLEGIEVTAMPVDRAGAIVPRVIVIHRGETPLADGGPLARYCGHNPNGYRWHWSVGGGGEAYEHLGFGDGGVHAAGLNDFAVGIEQDGFSSSDGWPEAQLRTTAAITAAFCRFIGRAPDRDFIIGHAEDNTTARAGFPGRFTAYGGSSSHTDPGLGFPWPRFMEYVHEAFDGEVDDLTKDQAAKLDQIHERALHGEQFRVGFMIGHGDRTKAGLKPAYLELPEVTAGLSLGAFVKAQGF